MKSAPQAILFLLVAPLSCLFAQELQHECGVALVRLRKPISYYHENYQDPAWGLNKLSLLMEKQRNRGQDSVGAAIFQFDMPAGHSYMKRFRSAEKNAMERLFGTLQKKIAETTELPEGASDLELKQSNNLIGNIYLGHVRYGTYAGRGLEFCQPCMYKNGIPAKSLALAGNFNMTNSNTILHEIISHGLAPASNSDTHLVMHQISYWIDKIYESKFSKALQEGLNRTAAAARASTGLNIRSALRHAAHHWDGGYVFSGIIGNGDAFICRDPAGIRPGYYYVDEEVFAAASERSALMAVFNVPAEKIEEIPPAHLIIIKKDGTITQFEFAPSLPKKPCVFERLYFSRANDPDIYQERKRLGKNMAQRLFALLQKNMDHVVLSYIPNSSEIQLRGLVDELKALVLDHSYMQLLKSGMPAVSDQEIIEMMHKQIHVEKLVFKDQAIRTFIAHDAIRKNLAENVYDITRGVLEDQDTLVVLDDSIVRGTTMRDSIMKQLIRLNPKQIVVLSAAPLIKYPDCYGIDMSQIGKLIAFEAAVALTKERGNQALLDEIYQECIALKETNTVGANNPVKKLYDQFTQEEIEKKIAQLIYPYNCNWDKKLYVMYQTIDGLHEAIPDHGGDWYFTGDYPTPGGYHVVVNSYINWYTDSTTRAY